MLFLLMMTPCSSISSSTAMSRSMLSPQVRASPVTGSILPREDGSVVSSSEAEPWSSSSSRSLIIPGMLSAV